MDDLEASEGYRTQAMRSSEEAALIWPPLLNAQHAGGEFSCVPRSGHNIVYAWCTRDVPSQSLPFTIAHDGLSAGIVPTGYVRLVLQLAR